MDNLKSSKDIEKVGCKNYKRSKTISNFLQFNFDSLQKRQNIMIYRFLRRFDWKNKSYFNYRDEALNYFFHQHNCGYPPFTCTERIVELSIADYWLNNVDDEVHEIGCVTPYYWPKRVDNIIDPFDNHLLNFHKKDLFDVDLNNKDVLSISTIEHIGLKQYGQNSSFTACDAFQKITTESSSCLVTFPLGYNKLLDNFICDEYDKTINPSKFTYYKRLKNNLFSKSKFVKGNFSYGKRWADNLLIYEK